MVLMDMRLHGNIAIDPNSELITATEMTAGNASAAAALLAEMVPDSTTPTEPAPPEAKPASSTGCPCSSRSDDRIATLYGKEDPAFGLGVLILVLTGPADVPVR